MNRKRFSICFLSSKHSPRDKRVFEKEAVSLATAGFRVVHLAPGQESRRVLERGVEIVTYRWQQDDLVGRALRLPRLCRLAIKTQADCYHCNEVDSWFVGVLLGLVCNAKVVFDVHEHYPSTFAEQRFPLWIRPLVAGAVRLVYALLTPLTDRLVFAKRSVARDFPRVESKQVFALNFASLAYRDVTVDKQVSERAAREGTVAAVHLGLISRDRGWPQLLEALSLMASDNLQVHVVGTFSDGSRQAFDQRVKQLGLRQRISTEEWMPFDQAYRRVLASDIGLVLFQPGIKNHVYALPHKMFDYMLAGLPVIAPRFAQEVAPIVRQAECGLLVDPSKPVEIAQALDYLVVDVKERRRLGANGRRAVIERYNWEGEAVKLEEMYLQLLGGQREADS